MAPRIPLTPELEAKIQNLIDLGLFDAQIEKQHGIPATWVKKYKKLHNIPNNYYKQFDTVFDPEKDIITKAQLEECIKKNLTINQAAEKLGVSRTVVTTRQKAWGLSFSKAKFDPKKYEELKSLGLLDKEIAEKMGMTSHGLFSRKKDFDLKTDKRNWETISKEDLEDLYLKQHLQVSEICKKLNKAHSVVYRYLNEYKITLRREDGIQIRKPELQELLNKNISIAEIAKIKNTTPLSIKKAMIRCSLDKGILYNDIGEPINVFTTIQKQLIYGGLLGDSYLEYEHANGSIRFVHGPLQKEYLEYKYNILKNFSQAHGVALRVGETVSYAFNTIQSRLFTDMYSLFYNPLKYVNKKVLDELDERGLAFWYMDDGYLHNENNPCLCTESFTLSDVILIQTYFKERWGITCEITKENRISFKENNGFKFIELIRPFILTPLFSYKLIKEYEKYKKSVLIKKEEWQKFTEEEMQQYVNRVFDYYKLKGFPYVKMENNKINKTLNCLFNLNSQQINKKENVLSQNLIGQNICNFYMPHIFETRNKGSRTPIEVFNNDILFKKAIKKRIYHGGSDMSDYGIRKTLSWACGAIKVSNFRPTVAKYIYDNYSGEGVVLDFSAGYGGRLLGAISSSKVKSYTGIEPCIKTYTGLSKMAQDLTNKRIILYNEPFEDITLEEKYDLAFSSPPYFNIEEYEYADTQSFIRYNTKKEWREYFLKILIQKSYNLLKNNGYFIINIANVRTYLNLEADTLALAKEIGFSLLKVYKMELSSMSKKDKYEPIFVFKKGASDDQDL